VIESKKVRWDEHVACKAEVTLNTNLFQKPEKITVHEDLKHACGNTLKRILLGQYVRILTALIWLVVGCNGGLV
jgi:hypothetical protein